MRVAVLGAGRIGSFRARVLSGLPEVEEVVVGNRTVERAEELAKEIGGRAGTVEEAIDASPDAAFVSLATAVHAEVLHRAASTRGFRSSAKSPSRRRCQRPQR